MGFLSICANAGRPRIRASADVLIEFVVVSIAMMIETTVGADEASLAAIVLE